MWSIISGEEVKPAERDIISIKPIVKSGVLQVEYIIYIEDDKNAIQSYLS